MPAHPCDIVLDHLVRAAESTPSPVAGAVLRDLTVRRRAFLLPDGGGRQLIQLGPELAEVSALGSPEAPGPPEPEPPEAAEPGSPHASAARALHEAASAAANLLQWQAMLPPNAAHSPQFGPGVLAQAEAAAAALQVAVGPLGSSLPAAVAAWWADILRRAGRRDDAAARWEQLRAWADAAGEREVAAYLELLRGDWLAAPLSSPEVWNCALQPTVGTDGSLGGLEQLEGWATAAGPEAAACYDRAEALLLGAAPASRAGAAPVMSSAWVRRPDLDLRRGWLAVVRGDAELAIRLARAAGRGYAEQRHLRGAAVAGTFLALAQLAAGRLPADVANARETRRWAEGDGGRALGTGLAQLCARVSRLWRLTGVMTEPALAALDLADALRPRTAGDEDGAPVTRHDVDRAQVLAGVGDTRGGRVLLEGALRRLPHMRSEAGATALQLEQATVLMQLYQLATAARDGAGMRSAAERFYAGGAGAPAAAVGAMLPHPGQDASALTYEAEAARLAGDDAGADALLQLAAGLAASGQPWAAAAVSVARHDYPAAADIVAGAHAAAIAALDAGELWAPAELVPAELRAGLLALQRRRETFQAFSGLVRLRDPARAVPLLAQLRQAPDPDRWWADVADDREAHLLLGRLAEQQGDLEGAAAAYERGVAAAERRRSALSSDALKTAASAELVVADLHRGACRVALRRGDPEGGFEAAMRGQARGLVDLLTPVAGVESAGDRLPADLLAAWRGSQAEQERATRQLFQALAAGAPEPVLSPLRAAADAAAAAVAGAEGALAETDPGYWSAVKPAAASMSLPQVQAELAEGDLLLQYVVDAGDVLVWAVTREGVVATHLAGDVWDLPGAAARLRSACASGGDPAADAAVVARHVVEPVAAAVRAAARVTVVASGPLVGVPVHALPLDGAPLGLRRPVTYLPSAALLPLLAGGPFEVHPALVVGDPVGMSVRDPVTGGSTPAPPLPGARVEARYVAALLPGSRCLIGTEATEDAVRAALGGARVVHLATHGYLVATSPLDSAVLLADGAALDAGELAAIRLTADLVVLSACHSGGGELASGDELMGLGRALLAAGARRVVVTLWDVDDVSAALLVGRFYARLVEGTGAAEALQQAAAWLAGLSGAERDAAYQALSAGIAGTDADLAAASTRRVRPAAAPEIPVGYAHPRHWAPFVLIGR